MIEMPNPFVSNSADVAMLSADTVAVPDASPGVAAAVPFDEYEPDMDALYDAIMPPEPPPIFLRSPSQAFMRALFELTH